MNVFMIYEVDLVLFEGQKVTFVSEYCCSSRSTGCQNIAVRHARRGANSAWRLAKQAPVSLHLHKWLFAACVSIRPRKAHLPRLLENPPGNAVISVKPRPTTRITP